METTFLSEYPTLDQMQRLISGCEASIETSREGISYRADNYYNCVDDYSSGGICDKAANENISHNNRAISDMKRQIENGNKPFVETVNYYVLTEMNTGKIVSEKIIMGKFGQCWIIKKGDGVTFVSRSKKEETYNKKGYSLAVCSVVIEYYYKAAIGKNGLFIKSRILSEKLIASPFSEVNVEEIWNGQPLIVYYARQNQEIESNHVKTI